jgi:transcriptional regulator with XRE-family HTH domain
MRVTAQTWGSWIADQLKRKNWTQAEAARVSGVPRAAFSQWMQQGNTQQPSIPNVRLVAQAFDVPILRALVIAGHLTEEEIGQPPAPAEADPAEVPTMDLIEEIRTRIADHLDALDPPPPGRHSQKSLRPDEVADVAFYNTSIDQTAEPDRAERRRGRP